MKMKEFRPNALHGVVILLMIVAIISVVTYVYIEGMGEGTEGYIYSNDSAGSYYKLVFGSTADPLDLPNNAILMNVVFDGVEPFLVGDHVQFFYEADGQHFRIYRASYL